MLKSCNDLYFLKRCHSQITARTSNDPISAATISRSEMMALQIRGNSGHANATDLVFRSVATLRPLYQHLVRELVLSVKAEQLPAFSAVT